MIRIVSLFFVYGIITMFIFESVFFGCMFAFAFNRFAFYWSLFSPKRYCSCCKIITQLAPISFSWLKWHQRREGKTCNLPSLHRSPSSYLSFHFNCSNIASKCTSKMSLFSYFKKQNRMKTKQSNAEFFTYRFKGQWPRLKVFETLFFSLNNRKRKRLPFLSFYSFEFLAKTK